MVFKPGIQTSKPLNLGTVTSCQIISLVAAISTINNGE